MHTLLLLLLLFSFFLCAPQQVSSSKPFFTSNKNRRILNEPSFPPSQPPNQPPHPSSISSTINTKHPVSTTTTTPNQSPFFPFYSSPSLPPPPPPPPSFSTFASFPANISSLVLPQSPKPKSSSSKLLPVTITTVACATVIITISAFVYCRRKRYVVAGNKTPSSENSISVFPPDTVTANGTRKLRHTSTTTSSEFLYLGTVMNSRGIEDVPDTRKMDSPELQPLPRLALQQHSSAPTVLTSVVASSKQGNEEKEEFYSPRGSSPGYDGNGSGSPAIAAENFYEKSGELSSNVSIALSSRSMLSSPERNQVLLSSSSPSLSPVHNHYVPSSKITYASSRRALGKNEDAFPRLSKTSLSPSSSAFSLPSSPEKAMHFGSLDQSPRISSFSDRFKQPGLSSLSLSPTLLSSPERELNESSNVDNVLDQFAAPPPSMPHWDIPLLSIPIGRGGNLGSARWASPNKPVGLGRAGKILGRTKFGPARPCSTLRPDQAGSNGVSPLQPQLKHWEVPTLSTAVDQQVSRPPELIPPSRPFVMQNPTTKVFSHVELLQSSQNLGETENTLKPKLKPLHWDKVRASSDGGMVWDQLKSSSFKLDEEMIETLFVVKPKVNTPGSVLPHPNQEERVLDPKKSQNIAILLRALNVTVEEVCKALLEGNADTLGTELLESLLKMAPSQEEEHKLKEHKDDSPTKLGPAEKFLKALLDVPFAFKRVEAMLYVANFESEVEYLRKSFQTLEAGCEELRNCRMFLKLLEAVLKTGNRMNVGTNRGDAQAFKLDTLLKLADVKGADGKTTLLHFVVQEIIRTEGVRLSGTNQTPSSTLNEDAKCRRLGLQVVSSLSSELANVKKAAAMDSEILSSDVSKLTKGIAYIAEVVKTNEMEGSDESSQKFTESMNKFIRMAEEEIPKIVAQERVALSLVKEITEYFHGNLAKEEAHPFRIFMVVRDFLTVLDRVCREVGMINERTMVSSAHKFPVPVNPMLPQPLPGSHVRQQYHSSDDDSASP